MVKIGSRNIARISMLLSGGVDSAAAVAFFVERGYHIEAVHFNYGQAAAEMELRAAQTIARHYEIKLKVVGLTASKIKSAGHINGRNAFLLFASLMEFPWNSGGIGVGIHAGTRYFDCTSTFVTRIQQIFDGYTDGRIRVVAPFLSWEKSRIWDFCKAANVPVSLTYSCEAGNAKPCGRCLSCKDLEVLRGI